MRLLIDITTSLILVTALAQTCAIAWAGMNIVAARVLQQPPQLSQLAPIAEHGGLLIVVLGLALRWGDLLAVGALLVGLSRALPGQAPCMPREYEAVLLALCCSSLALLGTLYALG